MLKASSLGIRFHTHHCLVPIFNPFPACAKQSRLVSTLVSVARHDSDVDCKHLPIMLVDERNKDGKSGSRGISSPFPYPWKKWPDGTEGASLREKGVRASAGGGYAVRRRPAMDLKSKRGRTASIKKLSRDTGKVSNVPVSMETNVAHSYETRGENDSQRTPRPAEFVAVAQAWLSEHAAGREDAIANTAKCVPRKRGKTLQRVKKLKTNLSDDGGNNSRIHRIQRTLRKTNSADKAWEAYQSLINLEANKSQDRPGVVWSENLICHLLTRVSRLLSGVRPPTRQLFLRYLSLLARLRQVRPAGAIYTWEWNTLINLAGSGFRKTPLDQYNTALEIYNDMLQSVPSSEVSKGAPASGPDIYTYTILLSIAARTRHGPAVRHAISLLHSSGLKPSRVTYSALARYRMIFEGLTGVRDGLQVMVRGGHEIGIDGVNAFIWAAGKEGQVEAALKVYAILRQHYEVLRDRELHKADMSKESKARNARNSQVKDAPSDVFVDAHFQSQPSVIEGITMSKNLVPDQITYTTMIQILTYHGYLVEALNVLSDMLDTPQRFQRGAQCFEPTGAVFRAFFRAYSEHGHQIPTIENKRRETGLYTRKSEWNWERLQVILDAFFSMPKGKLKPRARDIYWAMRAVEKCTGRNHQQCHEVWLKLKTHFHFILDGRMEVLDKKYAQLL